MGDGVKDLEVIWFSEVVISSVVVSTVNGGFPVDTMVSVVVLDRVVVNDFGVADCIAWVGFSVTPCAVVVSTVNSVEVDSVVTILEVVGGVVVGTSDVRDVAIGFVALGFIDEGGKVAILEDSLIPMVVVICEV